MTWILTNDDGIEAPGLKALAQAIPPEVTDEIVVVAPLHEQSGCGHQVTMHRPLTCQEADPTIFERVQRAYAIAGTPADCIRVALHHLCEDVTFVCSGINAGGNLGVDIYMSGTVAAVREAAFHGIPGIALSQYRRGPVPIDWARATELSQRAISTLLDTPLKPGQFWNVNLPHPDPEQPHPQLATGQSCTQPMPYRFEQNNGQLFYRGSYGDRPRLSETDVTLCFGGKVVVTRLFV